jgi:hypothetical protein
VADLNVPDTDSGACGLHVAVLPSGEAPASPVPGTTPAPAPAALAGVAQPPSTFTAANSFPTLLSPAVMGGVPTPASVLITGPGFAPAATGGASFALVVTSANATPSAPAGGLRAWQGFALPGAGDGTSRDGSADVSGQALRAFLAEFGSAVPAWGNEPGSDARDAFFGADGAGGRAGDDAGWLDGFLPAPGATGAPAANLGGEGIADVMPDARVGVEAMAVALTAAYWVSAPKEADRGERRWGWRR